MRMFTDAVYFTRKLETTGMPNNRGLLKYLTVHPYKRILCTY